MALSLEFQRQIVSEIAAEDGLLIMGRGLGLRRVLCTLLQIYAEPDNLVILINTSAEDLHSIQDEVTYRGVKKPGLRVIVWDTAPEERNDIYRRGGVISVTSRILAVDMLVGRMPTHLITGILVYNAHRVYPNSNEAWILRMFREQNKEGFIKAFSDQPESFVTGFAPLQNMMKTLLVRKVHLWPRYQMTVAEDLEKRKPNVVELNPQLSENMLKIQNAITECMDSCLREIKRNNPTVEIEELTTQDALFKAFDAIVRRQLDPVWHRVGLKTKQLISDMKTLRKLQTYLVSYDCVTFNSCLETILAENTRLQENPYHQQSPWLFMEAANTIISVAKERVYRKEVASMSTVHEPGLPLGILPILEECPKWHLLAEIMEEIELELNSSLTEDDRNIGTILIMVNDEHTSSQLKDYLSTMHEQGKSHDRSGKPVLMHLLKNHFRWKGGVHQYRQNRFGLKRFISDNQDPFSTSTNTKEMVGHAAYQRGSGAQPLNKRRRVRGSSTTAGSSVALPRRNVETFEQEVADMAEFINAQKWPPTGVEKGQTDVFDPQQFSTNFGLMPLPSIVIIRKYEGETDDQMLMEMGPRFIVMYDPDPAFVRRIEVYRASNPGVGVRVYFMVYEDSMEAQQFLSSVRKENESFQKLIREKSVMAIPIQQSVRAAADADDNFLKTLDTRVAGGRRIIVSDPPKIVVDIREFKCSLPPTLHAHGFNIVPYTLQVGDYILNPEMCVERKSIQDLIGSFTTGRLYDQCVEMQAHYKTPILLIEFDGEKSFSMKGLSDIKTDITETDLQAKLAMLMMAFPNLRIIWSSSAFETAIIFEDLKKNHEEPDGEYASRVGLEEGEIYQENSTSQMTKEFLKSLPGVTSQNWRMLVKSAETLEMLSDLQREELQGLIGEEAGKELYDFLNYDI